MQAKRIEPSTTAAERDMLEEWLDYHRATLEMKCVSLPNNSGCEPYPRRP